MFSLTKIKAFYSVFEQGKSLANKSAWATGQITATVLGGFFIALVQLAKTFGYDYGIDPQTCTDVAIGALGAFHLLTTVATHDHLGLPTSKSGSTEPPVRNPAPIAEGQASQEQAVQHESAPVVQSTIDDDTRARAAAWVAQHAQPIVFNSDA